MTGDQIFLYFPPSHSVSLPILPIIMAILASSFAQIISTLILSLRRTKKKKKKHEELGLVV